MQRKIGLADLELVRAIGAAGTLTGAARLLAVDHSTAFRRLGSIEARLGARLFERARNGYTATVAGEAALAAAAEILERVTALEHRLAGEDLQPSGTVRVTTTDTLVDTLAPVFADFRNAHGEITIEVVAASAFFTLSRRDADIAVRPAAAAPEALVGRRIATLATALYASPGFIACRPAGHDITGLDWIGFEDSLSHLASARWVAANVAPARVVCRVNSVLALRAAARAGMGVAALPCYLADPDPELRRLAPPIAVMASALWLLTHPDLRRVARIRAVVDFVAEHLTARRPLFEGRGAAHQSSG